MKILYGYRYGILGGVCTQLINRLAVFTGATDIEAHLVFGEDHGISRTLDGFSNLHFEKSPNRVRDLVRRLGIDVAVVIDTPEYLDAISTLDGFPVITEVHSTLDQGLQYLHERTWPTVGYIVPSAYLKELLEDRFGIGATDAVEICPNSIDPDLFPRTQVDPIPASSVFCWVGKLDSHKNWRGFVEIAGILKDRVPGSEFWMIGGETGLATEERDMLQEVHRVGLMERFRWFPRVEYRSMHRVYAAVRQSGGAQIVTSRDESFGMSVLEARLCGCPVVSPRVGALPEIAPGRVYLSFYEPGPAGVTDRRPGGWRGDSGCSPLGQDHPGKALSQRKFASSVPRERSTSRWTSPDRALSTRPNVRPERDGAPQTARSRRPASTVRSRADTVHDRARRRPRTTPESA
jgi:glycosyltransferase involved in cell wall biosynthesis